MRDRGVDEQWAEHQASRRTRWQSGSEYVDTDQRAKADDEPLAAVNVGIKTAPIVAASSPPTSMEQERMRKYGKIDANQPEIVDALRSIGAHVTILAAVGGGIPDLLVGYDVKDGAQPPSARLLTSDQKRWHAEIAATARVRPYIANSVSDALAIIGLGPKEAA